MAVNVFICVQLGFAAAKTSRRQAVCLRFPPANSTLHVMLLVPVRLLLLLMQGQGAGAHPEQGEQQQQRHNLSL